MTVSRHFQSFSLSWVLPDLPETLQRASLTIPVQPPYKIKRIKSNSSEIKGWRNFRSVCRIFPHQKFLLSTSFLNAGKLIIETFFVKLASASA
jgi:hypothetical protein